MGYKYIEQRGDGWYVKSRYSNKQEINVDEIINKFNICLLTRTEDCAKAYGIEEKIVDEIRDFGKARKN
jgi:hypothetical protein